MPGQGLKWVRGSGLSAAAGKKKAGQIAKGTS